MTVSKGTEQQTVIPSAASNLPHSIYGNDQQMISKEKKDDFFKKNSSMYCIVPK
jgi:hypothetical protein